MQLLALFVMFFSVAYSARILGIVPTPSYSHQIAFRSLWKELSLRGHQVVLLTTNPINNSQLTNLTEIDLKTNYDALKKIQNVAKKFKNKPLENMFKIQEGFAYLANFTLKHNEVQKLIRNETEHFDLVLVEVFYRSMFAFSKRFGCPLIGISSLETTYYYHSIMGNPVHPIMYPEFLLPFENQQLSVKDRFVSVFFNLFLRYILDFTVNPAQQIVMENNFKNVNYDVQELVNNISMMFVNANPFFYGMRPINPNTILFGGDIHIEEPKPLPKHIENFLNNHPEGIIYFSFGTNVYSKDLDETFKQVIIETIKSLPCKILWKYESDELENKPDNVEIFKWLPQQDVLRHPNVKLFVTQGGLQSIEESIYCGVPMVVVPFMFDQEGNAYKIRRNGMGQVINYKTVTKEEFRNTIFEVISNEKYRKAVQEFSVLLQDQPMTGLEKLIWWTEYVIRHKGAKHFKNRSLDMPLYQYFLLDVIAIVTTVILIILALIVFVLKQIKNFVYRKLNKRKTD